MAENFEQKVKQLLHDVQLEPHEEVWKNVRREIRPEKRKRRFAFWWLLPAALSGGALIYFMGNKESEVPAQTVQTTTPAKKVEDNPPTENKTAGNNLPSTGGNETILSIPSVAISQSQTNSYKSNQNRFSSKTAHKTAIGNTSVDKAPEDNKETNVIISDVAPVSINNFQTGITKTAVEENKKINNTPAVVTAIPDTAKKISGDVASVQPKKKKNAWNVGITTKIGLAGSVNGVIAKENNIVYASAPTSAGSSFASSNIHDRQTMQKDILFGIGVTARKDLSKRIQAYGMLSYEYQSFTHKHNFYKDSLMLGTVSAFQLGNSSINQRLQFVNVTAGLSFNLIMKGPAKIGISGSLDNLFVLGVKQKKYENYFTGNSISLINAVPLPDKHYKWQPHLNLSLPVDFTLTNKKALQLSPFLRYGFKKFDTQVNGKNHLMSFGISSTYFFR